METYAQVLCKRLFLLFLVILRRRSRFADYINQFLKTIFLSKNII